MKLRVKLLLFLFPPLLLSGLMINYLTGKAVCSTLHGEAAGRITAGAKILVETAVPDLASRQENELLPFLYSLATDLNAAQACFTDNSGTILAHTDVTQKGKKLPGAGSREFLSAEGGYSIADHSPRGYMDVYIPVMERKAETPEELALRGTGPDARRLGELVISVSLKDALETEGNIARKNAIMLAAVYAVILIAAFLLTSLVLRPIGRLMDGTERIRLGDYAASIAVSSRDELGDLARSFNEMTRTLSGTIVSKKYLDAILDNMLDVLVVTDLNGVIKKTNRAAQAALGAAEKELEGVPMINFFPMDKKQSAYWHDLFQKNGEVRDYETVMRTAAGASIPVVASASTIRDTGEGKSGVVVMVRDITQRKKYETDLARSNEDLRRFAFVASHDLQEPLRTVSNYVQMVDAKHRALFDPEAARHVDFIIVTLGRMRGLVHDLLEYSKTDAALHLSDVNTEEVLDYVLATLQDSLSASGAVVDRGHLPLIRADRGHVERLFQNLISNAVKFRNGEAPRISVGAEQGDGGWVFQVRDNGIGIDERYKSKLFKLFGRLHGKAVDGVGIGLATCKKIVDYYGGEVWFKSEPGKGSSFFFSIPGQPRGA